MSRALLTETERKRIAGDVENEQRRHESISRVRRRIREELPRDVEILRENHPTLFAELESVVCDEED
ncbi:hypothetical protein EAF64_08540 [Halorientalis pallida]|uniref:Uncharacterized protein n=1 Tax=Halorientalis pallida TaxID=2479928 RepID=A0A498L172_9EURY|nr:hypothetical protein EAF64_08540 [Halorientalis pallida]